jgi:hypothetical protein
MISIEEVYHGTDDVSSCFPLEQEGTNICYQADPECLVRSELNTNLMFRIRLTCLLSAHLFGVIAGGAT